MRWSKLRHRIQSGFAPNLGKRVRLQATRYRKPTKGEEGRWAILIDGVEVGGRGCIDADVELWLLQMYYDRSYDEAVRWQGSNARHNLPHFYYSVTEYTNISIEEALQSEDAVQHALAFLDRRLGKRRLAMLAYHAPRTELERKCLETRLRAEGMEPQWEDENC